MVRKTQDQKDFRRLDETKSQDQQPLTSTRGSDISTPAINPHNENPSLIALGKKRRTSSREVADGSVFSGFKNQIPWSVRPCDA